MSSQSTKPSKQQKKQSDAPPSSQPASSNAFRFIWPSSIVALVLAVLVFVVLPRQSTTSSSSSSVIDPLYDPAIVKDRTLFKVQDLPGKGKGMIAKRNIREGELIIQESPVLTVPSKISSSPETYLANSLKKLTPSQRSAFYNLSYVNFPPNKDPTEDLDAVAVAIVQTNGVAAGENNIGVFPRMARMNHGCVGAFNAVYSWREKPGVLMVHALKPIHKGEEILTAYIDTKRPRSERRAILKEHYGFDCTCSACSMPAERLEVADIRLKDLAENYKSFASWGSAEIDGRAAISHVRKIWYLADQEQYVSERGQLAADAARVAVAHTDARSAVEWAEIAIKWYKIELGSDSRQVKQMKKLIADPQKHPSWGTRDPMLVGGLYA